MLSLSFAVDPSEEVSGDKDNIRKEKKEREHLLALNQVLARQVMEKSRMVAGGFMGQWISGFSCVYFNKLKVNFILNIAYFLLNYPHMLGRLTYKQDIQ